MRSFSKTTVWRRTARALFAGCILLLAAGPAAAVDEAMLKRMEELIQKQQQQIEEQNRAMEAQNQAIQKLQQQVNAMTDTAVEEAREAATEAAKTEVAKTTSDVVRNKNGDKMKLEIYGHVNRAYLWADDGEDSDSYFVDNDSSSSRMGFIGEARLNDDMTLGGQFEFEYQSNASNVVSQKDKNPGDSGDGNGFDERWVDAQLTSKRFGKLYLGKGSTASDNIAEIDLSGTNVILYSDADINGGGIKWFDDDADERADVSVGDVFNNMDGLSRRNRLRYDSPNLWGFQAGGSVLSDGGDVTLRYAAKWGGFKIAAGAGYANPQAQTPEIDHQFSGSASILHDSGLSLTMAGGIQDFESSADRNDPTFYYAKLGYRHQFFDFGETRFGVDYGRHDKIKADGDEAKVAGFGIVQDLPKLASEYYLAYRWYDLDRDAGAFNDTDFENVNTIMTGVRVKF